MGLTNRFLIIHSKHEYFADEGSNNRKVTYKTMEGYLTSTGIKRFYMTPAAQVSWKSLNFPELLVSGLHK